MANIVNILGREILDSRGNPTIEVEVILEDNSIGRAAVPSGASIGSYEAIELRDASNRYFGKGVNQAINNVNTEIFKTLIGLNAEKQYKIDQLLIELDATLNKSRLGANAILGTSIAVAKAAAISLKTPFYNYIGNLTTYTLPVPMINIINGGKHANNSIDFQEFMIMPVSAYNIREAIRMSAEVFYTLKDKLIIAGHNTNVGDEGGFAPNINSSRLVLDIILESIESAGYKSGEDFYIALDAASSVFYKDNKYKLKGEGKSFSSSEMVDYYVDLINDYPIISIEDGMDENDWKGWDLLTKKIGNKIQLVGDDLFATNKKRLKYGINKNIANSILIKMNQIGSLTETIEAVNIAHNANYSSIMSHRSGETEDVTIADLSVALNCKQIKAGSLARSDRVAKYNQLIRIEEELGDNGIFAGKSILRK